MKCQSVQEQIMLLGELTEPERDDVMNHLTGCPSCMEFYESAQHVREVIQRVSQVQAIQPDSFRLTDRIMTSVKKPDPYAWAWIGDMYRFLESTQVKWTMAGISFIMIALFVIEIMHPIRTNMQVATAIQQKTTTLDARKYQDTLKKYVSARTERKNDCLNPFVLNQQNIQCFRLRQALYKKHLYL